MNPTNDQMLAEVIPPTLLPRVLSTFDLVTIYFALIFGAYGAAQMAAQGWAGIPMMALAAVTFLLPCALVAYELGTLFPGEGGIYIWAHKAFGPAHGFIAGWLSWVPIFQLLPLGATTIVAHLQVAAGKEFSIGVQVMLQVAIVWAVTGLSLKKLQVSQSFVRIMFYGSLSTAIIVLIAGLLHRASGTPLDHEVYTLNLSKYGALYSAAILWLLGVEVPFNMGAEFSNHKRTAGKMMLWGSVALLIGYFIGITGVLMTTPVDAIDSTTGVAKGVARVSPLLGSVVAVLICMAVASQDVAYMNAYSRLLFISGIEKRLPSVLGQVNGTSRVPVAALLTQALGATVVILIFSTQAQLALAFNLYIASLVAVWCTSLFYIYPAVIISRKKFASLHQVRFTDVWRIPGGSLGVTFVAVWGFIFNAVAIYYVFANPFVKDVSATTWRLWLAGISAVIVFSGLWVFVRSQRAARQGV